MDITFLIIDSQGATQDYALKEKSFTIGRGKQCDVQITDERSSSQHVSITVTGNSIIVEDLESKNGTYINGVKIQKSTFTPGDVIKIGSTSISIDTSRSSTRTLSLLKKNVLHDKELLKEQLEERPVEEERVNRKGYKIEQEQAKKAEERKHVNNPYGKIIDILISLIIIPVIFNVLRKFDPNINLKPLVEMGIGDYFSGSNLLYTVGSLLTAFAFYNFSRNLQSGSIGDKILKK